MNFSGATKVANQVAERWSHEIEGFDDQRVPGLKLVMQFTLLSEILKSPSKVTFPVPLIVRSLVKGLALLQEACERAPRKKLLRKMLKLSVDDWKQFHDYILFAAFRCNSRSDLFQFLLALSTEEQSAAQLNQNAEG
jgi:hypothetical protein